MKYHLRLNKYRVFRKTIALFQQAPRTLKRLSSSDNDYIINPPLLCNSIPKSGTHLLLQILEAIPNIRNYGTFLASTPAVTLKERSQNNTIYIIKRFVPGEIIPAHLYYYPNFMNELTQKNCLKFFIYRDPRDELLSEVLYITHSYPTHRLHHYFAHKLRNLDERITVGILGSKDSNLKNIYRNVAERYSRYCGWLNCEDICAVKFEDLVGANRYITLCHIAEFYINHTNPKLLDTRDLVQRMEANINPANSHTFRKGEVGGWKEVFTEKHKEQMKAVAGKLLVYLGYERNLDW